MPPLAHHALPDGFGEQLHVAAEQVEQLHRLPVELARDRAEAIAIRLRRMGRFPRR